MIHEYVCSLSSLSLDRVNRVSHALPGIFSGERATRFLFTSPASSSRDDEDGEIEENGGEPKEAPPNSNVSTTFPWRHSRDVLDRVVAKDDRSGLPNTIRARFVRRMLVAHELGVPWWSRFFGSWETELSDDFAWAFGAGLSSLLSCKFDVPLDKITNENTGAVCIDTISELDQKPGKEEKESAEELAKAALEEELRILYKSVDPTAINIKLKVQPLEWQLENAFLIPLLTRELVEENPSLRGSYQAIEQEFSKTGSVQKVREMGEQLAKDVGFGGSRTVIAEVSIRCLESFQVRDNQTGDVIQGSESEEEEVTHLVRFEMVTSRDDHGGRVPGNWQIIDWDDLLEGNVWH